jgi:hypothetical protein
MKNKNKQDDLQKELIESVNWARIDELIKEVKRLYERERNARAHRTNLLLGQKFFELRKLVTGTDEEFHPKSAPGRRWGKFVKSHLKGCGVSRATTYRCAQAWKAASAVVPEPILTQLAEREEMIGVAVNGERPLGKYTMGVEIAMETETDFESEEGIEMFIQSVFDNPEEAKKLDPMRSLYLRVIKGLVAIAKGRQTKTTMDGRKREVTAEMLCEPLYTLVSTVQRGIEMQGTHEYETANYLPEDYGDWYEVTAKKTEAMEVKRVDEPPKQKTKRKAKPKAQALESREYITETTPGGYYAKLNRRPKSATQTTQPWEIYRKVNGSKPKFCCRERSKQDAETQMWNLERMAEEEEQNTTTSNEAAAEAAAMQLGGAE